MTISFLDVIKQLLPNGSLFKIKPGGFLDGVFSGIARYVEEDLLTDADGIKNVRNPDLTTQLNDLERDHGLINDSNLSDADRRRHLNVFAFNKNDDGDRLFLQTRLRNAGFEEVNVIENSPPIDPTPFLLAGASVYCGDGNAYCGDGDAVIGESDGGELLIDGVNIYDLPADERRNFVFFVGGEVSGWILIQDWDMELHNTLNWAAGPYTFVDKDTSVSASGLRSLLVQDANSTDQQEPFPLSADPSLVSAYRLYDLDAALGRPFSGSLDQLVVDWDMSGGTSDWSITGGTISKTTSVYATAPSSLSFIVNTPVSDYVYQDILEVGKTYLATVYYRSGAQSNCVLINGGIQLDSKPVTSGDFEGLSFEFTAIDSKIGFSAADSTAIYIDSFICVEKPDDDILTNGSFEDEITGWSNNGASYSFIDFSTTGDNDDIVSLNKSLRLNSANDYSQYIYQSCLEIGSKYKVIGFVKGDSSGANYGYPFIKNGSVTVVYDADDDTSFVLDAWNVINFDFVATETRIGLGVRFEGESQQYGYFDSIYIYKIYDHQIQNIAPVQLIDDGSCEDPGTSSWLARNSATLSKVSAIGKGERSLEVAYNGVNYAEAYQPIKLEHGKTYRVSGYGQGSTSAGFSIMIGTDEYQYLLSSVYNFTFDFTCDDSSFDEIGLRCNTNSAGGWARFDHIYFVEIEASSGFPIRSDRKNHLPDGYCDDPLTTHWTPVNCDLVKDSANVLFGDYSLGIYPTSTGVICRNNDCCTVGKKYRLTGYLNPGDTSIAYQIGNGTQFLWVSTTDSGWQTIDVTFTATDTYVRVYFTAVNPEDFCFIDHWYLQEIEPENVLCENNVDHIGRSLYSDYPNHVQGYSDMVGLDNRWCISTDVKIPWRGDPEDDVFVIFEVVDQLYISRNSDTNLDVDSIAVTGGLLNGNAIDIDYPVSDNEWHNIIADFDSVRGAGEKVKIWVDGEQIGQGDITIPSFTNNINIGSIESPFQTVINDADGNIQNVMIYNCAKTDEEKLQIYRNFLDVFWGGYERRLEQSGTSNITQYVSIDQKRIPSDFHLLPQNISGNTWTSTDRDSKEFTYVGIYTWRTTSTGTEALILQGISGSSISVNWGDGNTDGITFSGIGFDDTVNNSYGTIGYKTIEIVGELSSLRVIEYRNDVDISASVDSFYSYTALTKIDLSGSLVSVGDQSCPWSDGIEIVLTSCVLTATEIDRLLNQLYSDAIENGILWLNGTNGDRTTASDTAYNWLIANGWAIFNAIYITAIDGDDEITSTQENVSMSGHGFLSTQGSGIVEICETSDYDSATIKVEQSVDSWSTDTIQFDVIQGTLLD